MADTEEDSLLASLAQAASSEKPKEQETDTVEENEEPEVDAEDEEQDEPAVAQKGSDDSDEDEEPKTRGQNRHQKLANELKQEREERARERKERDELIAERARYAAKLEHYEQQQTAGRSAADRQAEEQRLSLLDPAERVAYNAQQTSSRLEQRLNQMQIQHQDDRERSEFRSKGSSDPLVEKYADRVEQMRQDDIKKLGVAAPRDAYLNFIIGESVRKNAASKISSKKKSADKRIDSVTSKSVGARGDVKGSKSGKTVEERLAGVLI